MVFKHFSDHRKQNSQISFLQFLSIHYMHGSPKDKDYDEDMKLPFKSCETNLVIISSVLAPNPTQALDIPWSPLVKNKIHIYRNDYVPYFEGSDIWQPPKFS